MKPNKVLVQTFLIFMAFQIQRQRLRFFQPKNQNHKTGLNQRKAELKRVR